MADFGSVLRGLGSVLNPQVAQQLAQERMQEGAQAQQMGMFALQEQAAQRRMGQEQAFRSAEAEMARRQQAEFKVEELRQRHMDRMGEIEARTRAEIMQAQERGANQRQIAEMMERGRNERAASEQAARVEMARLMAALRQPPAPSPVTIADPNDPTKAIVIDSRTRQVIGNAPPKPAQEKSLPGGAIRELGETGGTATDFNRLTTSFKDEFGGYKMERVGDLDNWIKRNLTGDQSGQAQWWQDYQNQKNIIRNRLFGSALTATEKAEFDKAQINPGMKPEQIRTNLNRQRDLAVNAARKLAGAYAKGGYSSEQIEAALGMTLGEIGVSRKGQPSSSGVVDFGALK